MITLFDATTLKGMVLRNHLVRSATWEGMCDATGRPTTKLRNFYQALAAGGVGLIITGYTFVRPDGKQMPGKMGIHTDVFGEGTRRAMDWGFDGVQDKKKEKECRQRHRFSAPDPTRSGKCPCCSK